MNSYKYSHLLSKLSQSLFFWLQMFKNVNCHLCGYCVSICPKEAISLVE
ncbi:MAG: 4Fe-4S binding protein [Candidatus Marinimicrobia bacterium]|nr:4Fe-4S binding protein [Candidatus Neomarinimicrobiota bacterium]